MNADEGLLARVQRFEGCCIQKRTLEGDIEHALARRDEKATEEVEIAEGELQSTRRECAAIEARVEKARRGDLSSAEGSQGVVINHAGISGNATQEDRPPSVVITQSQSQVTQITRPRSDEIVPPTTAPLVLTPIADFPSLSGSVIPIPEQSLTGKPLNASEDEMSDSHLTSLAEQYTELCRKRQDLQEEIKEKLRRKERTALEKLMRTKDALDMTRQSADNIVATLMKASGGDAQIRVTTSSPRNAEARSGLVDRAESRDQSKNTAPASPLHTNTSRSDSLVPSKSSVAMSSSPTVLPVDSKSHLQPSLASHLDIAAATMTLPPSFTSHAAVPTPIKALPESNTPVEEWEVAIFQIYDILMPAAVTAARSGATSEQLPWPVLQFEHEYYSTTTIKLKDIQQDVVSDFIDTYSAWKGWSFQTTQRKMKSDWESVQKVFPKEKAGKKRLDNVVKCITAAV
jgi:hypothetical protein